MRGPIFTPALPGSFPGRVSDSSEPEESPWGDSAGFFEQPGLADAGGSHEHERAGHRLLHALLEQRVEEPELLGASDAGGGATEHRARGRGLRVLPFEHP